MGKDKTPSPPSDNPYSPSVKCGVMGCDSELVPRKDGKTLVCPEGHYATEAKN